jgi:undecaprenyl phosphate N,N'-diacetylbacillosamine 1-phosphate transferase
MYPVHLKRFLDIIISLLVLLLFSWLILGIILVYVLLLQFPILFLQERTGLLNQPFVIYKFRSLSNQLVGDRRFWWGDVLRFFSLDELPQLWNVLRGEMSLIGPRPLPIEYLPLMNEQQKLRHKVRPGITGWTQVNGRHEINWERKFELDEYYVKHLSFALDALIISKTILLVLSFRKDRSLSEKKFEGSK